MDAGSALIGLVGIAAGLWIMRQQRREIDSLVRDLEIANSWAARWEEQASAATEEAERATRQHEQLQALYCRLVREQFAANWRWCWPTAAGNGGLSDQGNYTRKLQSAMQCEKT